MSNNIERFKTVLTDQYTQLFELPEYALAAARHSPETLANKMTESLLAGSANKDAEGIKRTCKALGISYTYKAIESYLRG
jgi:hypothetical protein